MSIDYRECSLGRINCYSIGCIKFSQNNSVILGPEVHICLILFLVYSIIDILHCMSITQPCMLMYYLCANRQGRCA